MKDKIKNSELLKRYKPQIIFCLGCCIAYFIGKHNGKNEGLDIGTYAISETLDRMPEESSKEFRKYLNEVVTDIVK